MQHVVVIGLGYVGLPLALMADAAGYDVLGVDTDAFKRRALSDKKMPFEEPGFEELLNASDMQIAKQVLDLPGPAIYVIAVPTPVHNNGQPDLTYVESAARAIGQTCQAGSLIILESTSPVGTTEKIADIVYGLGLPRKIKKGDLMFAFSPERMMPGRAMKELLTTPRVVGSDDPKAQLAALQFYQRCLHMVQVHTTSLRAAEMTKLVENSYRDVSLAFANDVGALCRQYGVSFKDVARLANMHPRVHVLNEGIGVGGHCIPVDPYFLIEHAGPYSVMGLARARNEWQPLNVARLIEAKMLPMGFGAVDLYGMAYKENTEDFRGTPALEVARCLQRMGFLVRVHDPKLPSNFSEFEPVTEKNAMSGAYRVKLLNHTQYEGDKFDYYAPGTSA